MGDWRGRGGAVQRDFGLEDTPLALEARVRSPLQAPASAGNDEARRQQMIRERAVELLRFKATATETDAQHETRGSVRAEQADSEAFVVEQAIRLIEGGPEENVLDRLSGPIKRQRRPTGLSSPLAVRTPQVLARTSSAGISRTKSLETAQTSTSPEQIPKVLLSAGFRNTSGRARFSPVAKSQARDSTDTRPAKFLGDDDGLDRIEYKKSPLASSKALVRNETRASVREDETQIRSPSPAVRSPEQTRRISPQSGARRVSIHGNRSTIAAVSSRPGLTLRRTNSAGDAHNPEQEASRTRDSPGRKKLVTLQRSISAEPRDVATAPPLVGSASAGGEKERAGSYADGEAGKDARGEHRDSGLLENGPKSVNTDMNEEKMREYNRQLWKLEDALEHRDEEIRELKKQLRRKGLDAESQELQARVWELEEKLTEFDQAMEEMETMKMQLAARELELENKHIELLQMTKAEAAARASTASALEQVVQLEKESQQLRKGRGQEDTDEMKQMQARMVDATKVIKALNARIGEETTKNAALKKVYEERIAALQAEVKERETELQDEKKVINTARDQCAKAMASWSAAKSHAEKSKVDYESQLQESADEINRLRARDHKMRDEIKSLELRARPAPEMWDEDTQTENTSLLPRAIKSWIWLLTLVIAESVAFGEDGHAADSFEGVNESNPNRFARARKPRTEEAEVQTDDVHVGDLVETETNVKRVALCTSETQTTVNEGNKMTVEEAFWQWIVTRAEKDVAQQRVKPMTDPQVLSVISAVYSEKAIADFHDQERFKPQQSLSSFLWMYMLKEFRDKDTAKVELHKFVANLLMRVRQDSSLRAINLFSANRDVLQHRMMLFARFLGFWVSNPLDPQKIYDPIGPGGLQVYLTTLVRVREGQCPLLEPGVKSYKVRFDEFCAATDMVLAEVKFHEREAIKTEIADMNGKDDLIELEVSLEMVVDVWVELDERLGTRLEALFVSHDSDGDGDLDSYEYYDMMRKLDPEACIHDALNQRRIYAKMCLYNRVDAGVFCRAAREYGIAAFKIGRQRVLSSKQEGLGVRLQPVYSAAKNSIEEKISEISDCPEYPGMMNLWSLCDSLIRGKQNPEMAWLAFYHASRLYSSIMAALRKGQAWGKSHAKKLDSPESPQRLGRESRLNATKKLVRTNSYDKMLGDAAGQ